MKGVLDRLDDGLSALARRTGIRTCRLGASGLRGLHLEGEGRLPPLVLLHGLAIGSATQFVPYMLAARPLFRQVIAVDLPGHGESPPLPQMDTPALYAAVEEAVSSVSPEPPVVYGNSLGGAVALHYGLTRPTRG